MSIYAVSKLNIDELNAEIVIPMLPELLGKITQPEAGVILNPVPSGCNDELNVAYTIGDPGLGLICDLTS